MSAVATWAEFAHAEPDLAAFARERMAGRIVYQATLRLDGGPRVHPVSPWFAAGLLCVSFRDTSPKRREVARESSRIGWLVMLCVGVFVLAVLLVGIVLTHRIAGPVFRVRRLLEEN